MKRSKNSYIKNILILISAMLILVAQSVAVEAPSGLQLENPINISDRIRIDPSILLLPASIQVDSSPHNLRLSPDEVVNFSSVINLKTRSASSVNITQDITVLSGDPDGIVLMPEMRESFSSNKNFATVDNQEIHAFLEGVYKITTTAKIKETGVSAVSEVMVTVDKNPKPIVDNFPSSMPAQLKPATETEVLFTQIVQGGNANEAISVNIKGDVTLELNDKGENGDHVANDRTFSGVVKISSKEFEIGKCLNFQSIIKQRSVAAKSRLNNLCVSEFPSKTSPSDMKNVIYDKASDASFIANEILLLVNKDTSDKELLKVADDVNGEIIGTIPRLKLVQIRLKKNFENLTEFTKLTKKLESLKFVQSVSPNGIAKSASVIPSDTDFVSQPSLSHVRADEAWTIARGTGVTIAIVDSGADLNHPDLDGKIINGSNFVDPDLLPDDENGHGTHVAGIAAAETNNAQGIAGSAWDSSLYIVRVSDEFGNASIANLADGIVEAGSIARVVNVSVGTYNSLNVSSLCASVATANSTGAFVVAAAGNNGSSSPLIPAACNPIEVIVNVPFLGAIPFPSSGNAFSVGNTDNLDGRAVTSNFGVYLDIAAPGEAILSTVPFGGSCAYCNASGYDTDTGTSMSSPMVAGIVALMLSRDPSLTNADIESIIKATAIPLPGLELGAGRIDAFEAVFNGSFEEGNLAYWDRLGTSSSIPLLGSIVPQHRENMGSLSTGPAGTEVSGTLEQAFTVQPGVTSLPISFDYAFVTEEYAEWIGSIYDDSVQIVLEVTGFAPVILATESVNASIFNPIGGIDFPGGDSTMGWTDWQSISVTVPVTPGSSTFRIFLQDAGDAIYDTELMIDNIRFE